MYYTGFADEAAVDLAGQIKATKELGWRHIEARNINNVNIHDLSENEFEKTVALLDEAGVRINCFGSAIANWSKQINDPFDSSLDEVKRAIPRMKRLGTKLIRIMSFAVLQDASPDAQMEQERFRRLNIICNMFADEGLTPLHENCMNYGGMGWKYSMRLIEEVPHLKLLFDTANPGLEAHNSPRQSSWDFYRHVKEHIAYIHIKDMAWDPKTNDAVYTFPGEGECDVEKILGDFLASGYDGGISIEPHMEVVFHDATVTSQAETRYNNYIEYGRRLEKLINKIKADL